MLRKAIKSLFQLWTPLVLTKFQVFWGKVPGKVFNLDETLAPPVILSSSLHLLVLFKKSHKNHDHIDVS